MSATAINTTAQRKKKDEANSILIRELLTLSANKYCFECGQRGPTYANVTNGSFCCMHCSGLLRGLNPPHRVKSISMSTFTDDDVQKLRSVGNEGNARIWLGLYDKKVKFEPRVDDEVRQHLLLKYENRRWYVSPDDLAQQKRLLEEHMANQTQRSAVATPAPNNINTIASAVPRRDSISSALSNQSAPPNLHPQKANFVDLLTGDLPFTTSSVSSLAEASFARFDAQFDSLNLGVSTPAAQPQPQQVQLSQVRSASQTPLQIQQQSQLQQQQRSASTTVVGISDLAPTAGNGISHGSTSMRTGLTKDGKPIMSASTTLPDYSALEELFRGSSVSTNAPSFTSSFSTLSSTSTTAATPSFPISFGASNPKEPFNTAQLNGFNDAFGFVDPFGMSGAPFVSQNNQQSSDKNWNPFAS